MRNWLPAGETMFQVRFKAYLSERKAQAIFIELTYIMKRLQPIFQSYG
jgi:hypothetical protein